MSIYSLWVKLSCVNTLFLCAPSTSRRRGKRVTIDINELENGNTRCYLRFDYLSA